MIQLSDSISGEFATLEEKSALEMAKHSGQLTPKMVLSWLPKNTTPAQQDSMVRAHIKPCEIHWSTMPDTLHLPGHAPGKSLREVSLPLYYRESFFSKDSLFHPELPGGRQGWLVIPFLIQWLATISLPACCFFAFSWRVSPSRSLDNSSFAKQRHSSALPA